ncbi:type II toxin-antitoxin system RelE/ParE family toxin [Marivibrio halodurans]|uniref:Type II toxin-antitoxin system RelE/ParE family toxin n=1 Tax=Marivibrio halodurans TaxID=2039722 RepID=A0A8J7V488_9PROT|nr:type II toxin-antitoxin system RelE/ParE family toxin [Marivibrio halodurans]MBP5857419.1 type II toxin-antitoxin system RelE/ParE family toxin [Marivibrio halodurans]
MDESYSLKLTTPARRDLSEIRDYTIETHGRDAADAYDAVLRQALKDIREDPYRPGSIERPEIGESIRSFHTSLSRKRAPSDVKSPRHFVLYFVPQENEVAVSRILHDARDLARHVPDDHRERARKFKEERENRPRNMGRGERSR